MSDLGRKSTIDEIKAKYKFNPLLPKTVYVEGSTDRSLIQLFLQQSKMKNIIVLNINTIEISKIETENLDLEDNNRSRVITLTNLITDNIIGIIDSDFDFIKKTTYPQNDNLLKTDYANMEMYLFNKESLDKIFLSYNERKNSEYFLKLDTILIELFLIAFAKKELKNELSTLEFIKSLTLKSNQIAFDKESYLKKYLKNNKDDIQNFNQFIESKKTILPSDKREIIDGHDFVSLLQFYLEIKQKDAKEVFEKSLYSTLEYSKLKEENMFRELVFLLEEK